MTENQSNRVQETIIGLVKSTFGAIPYVGTLLNEVFFDMRTRIKQNRFKNFIYELKIRIERLEEDSIKINTLNTEQFSDLLEITVRNILENRSKEKTQIFADILASSMCDDDIKDIDDREVFLNVIGNITLPELKILQNLHYYSIKTKEFEANGKALHMAALDYSRDKLFGLKTTAAKIAIEGLISKGLVIDDSMNRMGTRPRRFIIPSPLGIGVIGYIEQEKNKLTSNSKFL